MTEEQFDELINLYLDNEIGRSDLGALKHAIKENLVRRRKFERACQLHQAARKALTSPSEDKRREARGGYPNSFQRGGRSQAVRNPGSGATQPSIQNQRREAQVNASAGSFADRQKKQSAASTVKLDRINLESNRGSRSRDQGGNRNYSFFDSPAGMLVAFLLTMAGCLGMYFILRATAPVTNNDQDQFGATPPANLSSRGHDPNAAEELAAEVKKQKAAPLAADDMRARLYESALTGQAAGNDASADYFSSRLDSGTADNASGDSGAAKPTPTDLNSAAGESQSPPTGDAPHSQP